MPISLRHQSTPNTMPPLHSLLRSAPTIRTSAATTTATSDCADASTRLGFKWVRDRGLDHAVEREKNLIPLINTKNLLNSEPSKSLPITTIAERRSALSLPGRPVDFLRRYPSVFREFLPSGPAGLVRPHFGLTAEALELHADEQLMYRGEDYRRDIATRVLKLLMLCRANRLPLAAIDSLRWDLGLPEDFAQSLIPDFPDYFRIAERSGEAKTLELVCWIGEFGNSVLEKNRGGDAKGSAIRFPTHYSRGFEMENKYKKWAEDWQKLPYFSPYENSGHISPKSDESDRWATAVLHEFLHILVPKKTEKENALLLGECLGLRGRLKRVMFQHPGIFYLSSKNDTYTLVLKEGYKRGVLVENHPLMSMRSKYLHLMNSSSREESKTAVSSVPARGANADKQKQESSEEENEGGVSRSSEDEEEDADVGSGRRRRTRGSGSGSKVKRLAGNPERRGLKTEKQERRPSAAKSKGSLVAEKSSS